MAVKGKEMVDYRNITIEDAEHEITLQKIGSAYEAVASNYALPLKAREDILNYGYFSLDEDCLVLYHPQNEREYSKLCIQCSWQGNIATVHIRLCDISKNVRKANMGSIGRNRPQFDAEMDWLRMVDRITNEVFEVQQ